MDTTLCNDMNITTQSMYNVDNMDEEIQAEHRLKKTLLFITYGGMLKEIIQKILILDRRAIILTSPVL
jgi:hypothetical protein